jgi:hypothetical protein
MGTPDRVVGVVHIEEREPGRWWGSPLAVDPGLRRVRTVGFGPFPNEQPRFNSGKLWSRCAFDLEPIPKPEHLPLDLWLSCFPSYGYILSVAEQHAEEVRNRFLARDLAWEVVGTVSLERALDFRLGSEQGRFWEL